MATKKSAPSWSDVKTKLADFDRAALLGLVQDLYAASKDNKAFLHARFGLGDDPLEPYKDVITQWINPPDYRKPLSVAKAKKAIGRSGWRIFRRGVLSAAVTATGGLGSSSRNWR